MQFNGSNFDDGQYLIKAHLNSLDILDVSTVPEQEETAARAE